MAEACLICERITGWRENRNPYFVHEFRQSILVVGEHQFHRGYALLLLKEHRTDLHELAARVRAEMFEEVSAAARALVKAFRPWRINYACYGNVEPHLHWHLFPRYKSDPDYREHPWLHSSEFKNHLIDTQTARSLAEKIRTQLTADADPINGAHG